MLEKRASSFGGGKSGLNSLGRESPQSGWDAPFLRLSLPRRCRRRSAGLALELLQAIACLFHRRLQFWIGVFPQVDETRVVGCSLIGVSLGVVQLGGTQHRAGETIHIANDASRCDTIHVPLE